MDAIVSTGGRQEVVHEGEAILIDYVPRGVGERLQLRPLALLDGDDLTTAPEELARAAVEAEVLDVVKGPKVRGFTYKPKANERRRFGHRQRYLRVRITSITRQS